MPRSETSAAQAILDELVLSRRRMLAGEEQDADLLEANRQAIAYWAKRLRGGRAERAAGTGSATR